MENKDFFMERLMNSLDQQTFKNFEVIVTEDGKMAENTNSAIKKATGDIIKLLYMDDYLYDKDALKHIYLSFTGGWLASGCIHDDGNSLTNPHFPKWSQNVKNGVNTIGSPSVVAFANDKPLLFNENLSWMLDVELYGRLFERYGEPTVINYIDVGIGLHPGQTTHLMSDEEKQREVEYVASL